MPAIICYVFITDGREVQVRVRYSQRVAIPLTDMPEPPAGLLLVCPSFTVELKYVTTSHGFAVYYISSVDFDRLVEFMRLVCSVEPCRLPCVLRPTS